MASGSETSAAVASGDLAEPEAFDVRDDEILAELIATLAVPRPIDQVEAVEAWIKRSWVQAGIQSADAELRRRFAEFFRRLGFVAKYKSYGVKYAAPFGYTLFDLQDNSGFSIQLHESAKVEAFHVLGLRANAFLVLCSLPEWQANEADFVAAWAAGHPETSPIAYRPSVGDVAVVEDLSTVHTVIGCVLEEFATSSYDVVLRLHDQNQGRAVQLPDQHRAVPDVLAGATGVQPRRQLRNADGWQTSPIPAGTADLAYLPGMGLIARHLVVTPSSTAVGTVASENVVTVFVLEGALEVDVDGATMHLEAGEVTALAPGSGYRLAGSARVSWCEVAAKFAFEDLRTV
jgi:hypothetical protein